MTERPMLFSAPMVRAILDGRKTMTRRVMKPQPTGEQRPLLEWASRLAEFCGANPADSELAEKVNAMEGRIFPFTDGHGSLVSPTCPYGIPGDRLWVRETWRVGAWREDDGEISVDYKADGFARREWLKLYTEDSDPDGEKFAELWRQCTDEAQAVKAPTIHTGTDNERFNWEPGQSPCRWRPSIFMPRSLSRIKLELTGVKVERLQEMSEQDAVDEGIELVGDGMTGPCPAATYAALWDDRNAKRGFSWASNPWVWVLTFKRLP